MQKIAERIKDEAEKMPNEPRDIATHSRDKNLIYNVISSVCWLSFAHKLLAVNLCFADVETIRKGEEESRNCDWFCGHFWQSQDETN